MTPRLQIVWVDADAPREATRRTIAQSHYSRIVVCRGSLDQIIGVVSAKDLLSDCYGDDHGDLLASVQTPVYVPESLPALHLLEKMKADRTHLVLVVDEHGGTQGLVTLHDLLSAMVGDLPSEDESDESYVTRREDGSLLLEGATPLVELKEYLALDELPGEKDGNFSKLSGFLMTEMGRIPKEGDTVEAANWKFEVMDMDGHRIDKVLVSPLR